MFGPDSDMGAFEDFVVPTTNFPNVLISDKTSCAVGVRLHLICKDGFVLLFIKEELDG